jgi:hypothetical protein
MNSKPDYDGAVSVTSGQPVTLGAGLAASEGRKAQEKLTTHSLSLLLLQGNLFGSMLLRHAGQSLLCNSKPTFVQSCIPLNPRLLTAGRRSFSQSASRKSYTDTIQNLLIHKDTKVLCQGFTGKTVSLPMLHLFIVI